MSDDVRLRLEHLELDGNQIANVLSIIECLQAERDAAVKALAAWADWIRADIKNAGKPLLDCERVMHERHGTHPHRCCDFCCMHPGVSQEEVPRKHPWHYDDCPVLLTSEALEAQ